MTRNSTLVSHAFRNYLRAALLYSAFMQLAVIVDVMVAGHFIGPDALTAINMALPLTTIISAISSLIGLGPAVMAAKAIGGRNTEKVNSIFSSAMYQAIFCGILMATILYLFLPHVADWLCSSEQLLPYLKEYLQVMPVTFCFILIVSTMLCLIESDGRPDFVTKAIAIGSITNVLLDVALVKFFNMGIQGLAFAMLANYLSIFIFFLFRMKSEGVSYRWTKPDKNIVNLTLAGLKEGASIMLNDLIYSLMLLSINSLLLIYYGNSELYLWAIFLQVFLLVMVIVDCAEGAILSIGSVLHGEDDMFGLRALVRRSWLMLGGIVLVIVIIVCAFPVSIAMLFSESGKIPENCSLVIRVLSLMLIPYALTTFMRSVFQVLGDKISGIFFSVGQLIMIVVGIYLSTKLDSQFLWWSFPIASWIMFAIQFIYLQIISQRRHVHGFSIIPPSSKKDYLDISVYYNKESVTEAIQQVCSFLQEHKVKSLIEMEVNICCEELMTNIVMFQNYKTRLYMDLSVIVDEHRIFFVLKDSGRPFNPLLVNCTPEMLEKGNVKLGLFLVNNVCTSLTHKYMYGLNVVFAEFDRQQAHINKH